MLPRSRRRPQVDRIGGAEANSVADLVYLAGIAMLLNYYDATRAQPWLNNKLLGFKC
jgi:hypothetical protein